MQSVKIFETLGGGNGIGAAIAVLIKTTKKSISRLRDVNYPSPLSP